MATPTHHAVERATHSSITSHVSGASSSKHSRSGTNRSAPAARIRRAWSRFTACYASSDRPDLSHQALKERRRGRSGAVGRHRPGRQRAGSRRWCRPTGGCRGPISVQFAPKPPAAAAGSGPHRPMAETCAFIALPRSGTAPPARRAHSSAVAARRVKAPLVLKAHPVKQLPLQDGGAQRYTTVKLKLRSCMQLQTHAFVVHCLGIPRCHVTVRCPISITR